MTFVDRLNWTTSCKFTRMAINFCHREFGTLVSTTSVSADGYEVENLLGKKTVWGQPKGFMAEPFIKPPVDVTFMFPFNIWLQKILIDPKVGSQRSSAFEVFTASASKHPCQQENGKTSSHRRKSGSTDCDATPTLRSQSQMESEKDTVVFASIGKAFSVDRNTALFCFVNHSYQPIYPRVASDNCQEERNPGVVTRSLRYTSTGALTNVSYITIRAIRANGGSVAIKSVQIWGQPSNSCPKPTVKWVLRVAESIQNPQGKEPKGAKVSKAGETSKRGSSCKAALPSKTAESCESSADLAGCPEEFIDPITNDLLMLPVLLPSGHTVDSETLRKHGEAEALWGRPPSDPFTGIPFSQGSKPLPNVKLKERLDRYLLSGVANVTPSARDVGRSKDRATSGAVPSPASLVSSQSSASASSAPSISKEKLQKTRSSKNFDATGSKECVSQSSKQLNRVQKVAMDTAKTGIASKRKLTEDSSRQSLLSKRRTNLDDPQKDEGMSMVFMNRQTQISSSSLPSAKASPSCHEEALSQSLDSALESALSGLPSFSNHPLQSCNKVGSTDDAGRSWSCSECHNTLATKDGYHVDGPLNMYTLPCTHLICRDCLLSHSRRDSSKCTVCGRPFHPSDVVKVHV